MRVLLAFTIVALAATDHVSPWITKGFGYSTDGYNGAMWGLGARGRSRIRSATVWVASIPAATATPTTLLLVWTTAVTGVDRRAAGRPAPRPSWPAWSPCSCSRPCCDAGFGLGEIAGGLAVAGTSAMFLTYGAMLDTPVLSLPFGLAAIGAAQRAWQGRPPPAPVLVIAGLLAALAGWQSLLAVVVGAALTLCSPSTDGRRAGRILGAGAAAGLAITLAWIAWVKGTLLALGDQAAYRAGIDTAQWLDRQQTHAGDLYGPVLLVVAAVGLVLAVALPHRPNPDVRCPDAPLLTGATCRPLWRGGHPLHRDLPGASALHDYWTFWVWPCWRWPPRPLLSTRVVHVVASGCSRPAAVAVHSLAVVGVVVLALSGAGHRSRADQSIQEGLGAVPVLAAAPRASSPDQATIVVRGPEQILPWADFATGGRARGALPADLARLPPDTMVFLIANGDPSPEVRTAAAAVDGRYVLIRAGDYQRIVG